MNEVFGKKTFKKKLTSMKLGGILINVADERLKNNFFKTVDFHEIK